MSLAAGTRLGPYEIVAPIGAGGMGEVYRARDTRLAREVAIKVSAERFSERFEKEAHAIASLNHPNICTLHDVGPNYLVMELVEGPTLADRTALGKIPLAETLAIIRQIADALEAAHEKNIVHRDLKPANIKVKPDGTVKVLDFGLAKTADPAGPGSNPENSPTLTLQDATRAGVILGTAGYMSPEQASGKPVDKRADIWSFGVVLWEMLTGKRMFSGETVSHTIAAVLIKEPDWQQLPADTPTSLKRLLKRCLERDLKRRLGDIGTARLEIEEAAAGPAPEVTAPSRSRLGTRLPWIAIAAVLALAASAGWVSLWRATRPVERPLARLEVDLGADVALPAGNTGQQTVVLSPDGTRLVYVSGRPQHLFTRRLDQPKATQLPGTDGASIPFFSPDGQWVGFFTAGKLNKISVEGGAVVPLAEITIGAGADWGTDGTIVVGGALTTGMVRVPASGGPPAPLTQLAAGELAHIDPQILPGGKAALFTTYGVSPDVDKAAIEAVTFADRHRKVLVRGGTSPLYLPSGHLVYVNKGTLFAIPFDPGRLETHGTAVPVLDDVEHNPTTSGASALSFSRAGTLLYRRGLGGSTAPQVTFQWLDPSGKKDSLLAKPSPYNSPRLSPDGKRLALSLTEAASQDVWVYDPQRDSMTRLTFGGLPNDVPVWTPDGRKIVFASLGRGLMWTRADGAGQPQPLVESKGFSIPWSFTPDGKRLAYMDLSGAQQILTVSIEDQDGQLKAGKPEPFLKTKFNDAEPGFSPDGRWLAYESSESGKNEVYVRAFPQPASGQGGKWQISNAGGDDPRWSRASHELIYKSGDQLLAAAYTVQGDTFVADKPRVWIDKLGGAIQWDLAPDGKRALVRMPVAAAEAPKQEHTVMFLENFFDELRRRVPVK